MVQIQLKRIEIPGLAEAYRRERGLRDAAFGNTTRRIGPFTVRLMTLRDLCWLDAEGNGWLSQKPFKDRSDALTHGLALIWHLSLGVQMPRNGATFPLLTACRVLAWKVWVFLRGALCNEQKLLLGISQYLEDRFFDSPRKGSTDNPEMERSFAAGPASVVDLFAAGGYCMSEDDVLDMPLDRLWQYGRLIADRLGGTVANPSDWVKADYMERRQRGAVK